MRPARSPFEYGRGFVNDTLLSHTNSLWNITTSQPQDLHRRANLLLVNGGGPMISNIEITLIWYDGSVPYQSDLTAMNTFLVQSDFMNNFIEYATPTQIIGKGTVVGSYTETNIRTSLTDNDVKTYIRSLVQTGKITPNQNSYYSIYMKDGVTVTDNTGAVSCQGFGAYHNAVYIGDIYNIELTYFAVLPMCGGTPSWLGVATSHELAEAVTDSWNGWRVADVQGMAHSGDEIADICEPQSGSVVDPNGRSWSFSKIWSNAKQQCVLTTAYQAQTQPTVPTPATIILVNSVTTVPKTIEITPIFLGASASFQTELAAFYNVLVTSSIFDVLSEYGVGQGTTKTSYVEANTPSSLDIESTLKTYLRNLVNSGTLQPNINSFYPIHLPPNSGVTAQGQAMDGCNYYCNYRSSVYVADISQAQYIYFEVFPDYTSGNCVSYCGYSVEPLRNIEASASGAVVSQLTTTWTTSNGMAADTLCSWKMAPLNGATYSVQKLWSNKYQTCLSALPSGQSPTPLPSNPTQTPYTLVKNGNGAGYTSIEVTPIFLGSNANFQSDLASFYSAIVSSGYFDLLSQYGIARGTVKPSYIEPTAPSLDQSSSFPTYIKNLVRNGAITPNSNSFYAVHLPPNTDFKVQGQSICQSSCSLSGSVYIGDVSSTTYLYYGIFPDYSSTSGSCSTGCGSSPEPLRNIEAYSSNTILATIIGNWKTSNGITSNTICSGQVGPLKIGSNIWTVRKVWSNQNQACLVVPPVPLINNWQACQITDVCASSGWVCCVAPEEISTGRPTCRPSNVCAGASSTLQWLPIPFTFYQGGDIAQNVMSVPSCTGWCASVSNCVGAVYTKSTNLCALKSILGVSQASLNNDGVTYIPSGGWAPGFDFWDNAISTLSASGIDDCRGKCSRTVGCVAGIYGPGVCRLRSDFSGGKSVQPLTTIVAPATGSLVANWQDCTPINACASDGWVCCVAPEEVSSGRPTCRPINMCAGASSSLNWTPVQYASYQGSTIQQNTMTVASCTGWCAAVSNCLGAVYSRSSKLCVLESTLASGQASLSDDSVTYIPSGGMAPGFDFWDNTISTIWAANIDDCRGKCSRTSGCIAAVYGPGMCRLRSDFSGGRSVQPLTAIVAPATGNLVSNWQDCTPVNACVSDGWVCCVAPEEVSSGRPTCRPINMCAGASSSLNWTPVQYASYQGSTIQQNTMTVASCTGWCAAVSNCLGAVYSRSSKLCVLESTLASGQASLSDDSVTYIPSGGMAPGFDFWDNTISTIWAANIDDCRGKCSRTSGCIAAVYGPGMCRLRSDFSGGRSVQPLTAIVAPATGNLVSNWQDCTPVNACVSDGWVCCVAPEEVSSGRPTCRPINMCAGASSSLNWTPVQYASYQGSTIQQNTMTVASCTGWCAAVSNCLGAVYSRSSKLCVLKSTLASGQASLSDDSVTYIPSGGMAPGFDFWDNTISTIWAANIDDCRGKCSRTSGCIAAVYGPGMCRLRSDFSGGRSVQPLTAIVAPATGNLVSNWQDCTPVNACVSDGWVCCVAPEEVSSGRPTCRPINMCAGSSSLSGWVGIPGTFYQGGTIQQNTMTVASCTGWCAAVSNCVGTVYTRSSTLCTLKSVLSVNQAALNDDSVTYITSGGSAPGFDFWDNLISTQSSTSVLDCRTKCSQTQGCLVGVYGPGICRLRSDFSGGKSVQPVTTIVVP